MISKYELLGVNLYDDIYIIKDAYNKLIRKYKNIDLIKYTNITEAYDTLKNKKSRSEYDIELYNDYIDLKYKTYNIVNVAYIYYRNNDDEEAIKLLLNIKSKDKYYFDAAILLSNIYKETVKFEKNESSEYIRKNQYNYSENVLLRIYEEYKDNNNFKKAIVLIELIDLYCLMNNMQRVELFINEINVIHLFDRNEVRYIENKKKELKKKYKHVNIENKIIKEETEPSEKFDELDFAVLKVDNNNEEIKRTIEELIEVVNYEIDNGFTEKIKINRKLERFKGQVVKELTEMLVSNSKNNQIRDVNKVLKLVDNAIEDIGEEIVALKNIKEKSQEIILVN